MTYHGDYEDLIDWITETYPPKIYDTFFEWLSDVRKDFAHSGHHFSDDIASEMKGFWVDNNYGPLGESPRREERYNYDVTFNSVVEKGTFTLSEAYKANESRRGDYSNTESFRGGIRRDLQKLVKNGSITRIEKGLYKINA